MSDFMKKKYTLAEPGCGITVFSMEGSEVNLFGSRTMIKTSEEDIFEPIQDFLYEKFVEEKADTMYYIGVAKTVFLGVLAGVAIVGGVIAAVASGGAAAPLLGLGFALAGSAIASYDYTFNTLQHDRVTGYDRSWLQFYLESNLREGIGAVAGGLVFVGLWTGGTELIGAVESLINGAPSIANMPALGGTSEIAVAEEAVLGLAGAAALIAAAIQAGKGGESKEGVEFKKGDEVELETNEYYKEGLEDVPDDWNEIEVEEAPIKSDAFKEYLNNQGKSTKGWKKVMEKWASPDGTIYQRHYWTNGIDYYYHDGIIEYFPH